MKSKFFFHTILFSFLLIVLSSCNQDETLDSSVSELKSISTANIEKLSTPYNTYDIEKYLTNLDDPDETKNNKYLLDIATTTREFLKESSMNDLILERAKTSANSCIAFSELLLDKNNKYKRTSYYDLKNTVDNADLTHRSTNPLKRGVIEEYIPAIFVPNWETADVNKQPIICPGIEVNSELPGMEDYEDYIVAWYYDENEELQEIIINEEFTMKTSHPVFIIDNTEEEMTKLDKSVTISSKPISRKSKSSVVIKTHEFQINHRFESSGDSEFCIAAAMINENGGTELILKDGGYTSWKEISSVSKRNIGRAFTEWNQFYDETEFEYIFWNTFERDWYNSSKSLGQATRNGTTIYLSGNRQHSSDWYGFDPSTLDNNPLGPLAFFGLSARMYSNSRGHLGFRLAVQ